MELLLARHLILRSEFEQTQQVLVFLTYVFSICLITFLNHLGNVYIADTFNHRIRKVTVSTGIITTFAGTGTAGYSGDGGAA